MSRNVLTERKTRDEIVAPREGTGKTVDGAISPCPKSKRVAPMLLYASTDITLCFIKEYASQIKMKIFYKTPPPHPG